MYCIICGSVLCKRAGPAPVPLDDFVDLLHQPDGPGQSDDDLLVVGDVVLRERVALAVLMPLLADLVAADVVPPHVLAYALEATGLRFVDPIRVLGPRDLLDLGASPADEIAERLGERWRFQQVKGDE